MYRDPLTYQNNTHKKDQVDKFHGVRGHYNVNKATISWITAHRRAPPFLN